MNKEYFGRVICIFLIASTLVVFICRTKSYTETIPFLILSALTDQDATNNEGSTSHSSESEEMPEEKKEEKVEDSDINTQNKLTAFFFTDKLAGPENTDKPSGKHGKLISPPPKK